MYTKWKILLAFLLFTAVVTTEKICEHLGFGQAKMHHGFIPVNNEIDQAEKQATGTRNYFVNDSVYRWDEQLLDWIPFEEAKKHQVTHKTERTTTKTREIRWHTLMDIHYRLRYFSEFGLEIYAPVFPNPIEAFEGKEVIVEGFVIPFDEEQKILALSANPYASCFFCGKASPASVMSMYLKNEGRRYKIDDFKKFRGTLHLNQDNPNEFYYILRNAEEK